MVEPARAILRIGIRLLAVRVSSGPASGVAGGRGDDLSGATHTQRSEVPDRDGQFVSALVRVQREGKEARGPRPRDGPLPDDVGLPTTSGVAFFQATLSLQQPLAHMPGPLLRQPRPPGGQLSDNS